MRRFLLRCMQACGTYLSGKGLRRLPFITPLYSFFYKHVKPRGVVETRALDLTFFINSADSGLAPWLIMGREFEPVERKALESVLKPGMLFVDVGANIGYFSLIAARLVGETGRVWAFEPEEENFSLLRRNIAANGCKNITPTQKAVAQKSGTQMLYKDSDNLCAHSLLPKEGWEPVVVGTVSLDEFFKNTPHISVIKIDVEGAEMSVLAGMKDILEKNPQLMLIIEFYPNALRRAGTDPLEMLRTLYESGFRLTRLDGEHPSLIPPEEFPALSRGEGMGKLMNILCVRVAHDS